MTGSTSPKDIEFITEILLNDGIAKGYASKRSIPAVLLMTVEIKELCYRKGLSLNIILKELTVNLMDVNLPSKMKEFLYKRMTQIE